jgi:hypothetical protein
MFLDGRTETSGQIITDGEMKENCGQWISRFRKMIHKTEKINKPIDKRFKFQIVTTSL